MSSSDPALLRPSKTAELAAAIRALHLRRVSPPIFEDHLAQAMCGPFWRTVVSSGVLSRLVVDGVLRRLAPIMPAVYVRARFGEDRLEEAVGRGLEQYVIIGAGYETLAMRRADLMARLTVYELDQAATQETKRQRMRKAGIPTPQGLRYVAADLNAESLEDALDRAGFDAGRPALFSWFGVTFYLGEDAIRRTLTSIATSMAPWLGGAVRLSRRRGVDSGGVAGPAQAVRRFRGAARRALDIQLRSRRDTRLPGRHRLCADRQYRARTDRPAVLLAPPAPRLSALHRPMSRAMPGLRSPEDKAALPVRALSRRPSSIQVNGPA